VFLRQSIWFASLLCYSFLLRGEEVSLAIDEQVGVEYA